MRTRSDEVSTGDQLRSERDLLLRSIEDLESEYAAGDIDEVDYENLRADYVERAAGIIRRIETLVQKADSPAATDRTRRPRRRRRSLRRALGRRRTRMFLGTGAAVCLCGLVAVVAAHLAGVRLPGQPETGGITLTTAQLVQQELAEASTLAQTGQVAQAVKVYSAVLAKVPDQHEALTYFGWLTRLAGISARSTRAVMSGDADLARAASLAPGYADARGLYGVALASEGRDPHAAVVQFTAFLADRPNTALLAALGPEIATTYSDLRLRVPPEVAPYEGRGSLKG